MTCLVQVSTIMDVVCIYVLSFPTENLGKLKHTESTFDDEIKQKIKTEEKKIKKLVIVKHSVSYIILIIGKEITVFHILVGE